MKISYFQKINSQKCHQVTADELLSILNSDHVVQTCKGIREQMEMGNDEEARKFKTNLPIVCISRLFDEGAPRKKDTGIATGLIMVDYDEFDGAEEIELALNNIASGIANNALLYEHIVAVHRSPMHGIHIWFRWIDGCKSVAECQAKLAEWLEMPDYDKACKDNSRCSFLVPYSYFTYLKKEYIDDNEHYATLQQNQETNDTSKSKASASGTQSNRRSAKSGVQAHADGAEMASEGYGYDDSEPTDVEIEQGRNFFKAYLKKANQENILTDDYDKAGHTNHNSLLMLLSLGLVKMVRKKCLYKVLEAEMPNSWADDTARKDLERLIEGYYTNYYNPSAPLSKDQREVFTSVMGGKKKSAEAEEQDKNDEVKSVEECLAEIESIDESIKKYVEIPKKLPPIFQELVATLHSNWKPAGIVALLPMLGVICSKARGKYAFDGVLHSPSFMAVIEAPAASGKSQLTRFEKIVFERFDEMNAMAENEINIYNAEVNKANGAKELKIDPPDVCLRKVDGKFTEAGLDKVMNFYHELHMWLGASEIDEVSKMWDTFSYILRKVFDNDKWGRTIQSSKNFVGSRPLFLNVLLLGTPRAVAKCYGNPEDGLVHRTIFFKLMYDLPTAKRISMADSTRKRLVNLCNRIHDKFCFTLNLETEGSQLDIADEQEFNMQNVNKWLEKWLLEKNAESVITGMSSTEAFRRRAAVIGFRAGIICKAIYSVVNNGKQMTKEQTDIMKDFVLWVAEFTLNMLTYKFGEELNKILDSDMVFTEPKKERLLEQLPDEFTLKDAYKIFPNRSSSAIRCRFMNWSQAGLIEKVDRGKFKKKGVKK